MPVASAAAQTAARFLAVAGILAITACEPAVARPWPHRPGTFCAPVIAERVGLVRICGIPNRARR
jgi:hypothetical protein